MSRLAASSSNKNINSIDPLGGFRFLVQIDQLQVGGFSEISGLQAETKYETYEEGGQNGFVHRFPTRREYPPLVLKRGVLLSLGLWNWYNSFTVGKMTPRDGSIMMASDDYSQLLIWNFIQAYPVKWIGPQLNAGQGSLAVESLELVHQGLSLSRRSNTSR